MDQGRLKDNCTCYTLLDPSQLKDNISVIVNQHVGLDLLLMWLNCKKRWVILARHRPYPFSV